jgi:hypothetical protein
MDDQLLEPGFFLNGVRAKKKKKKIVTAKTSTCPTVFSRFPSL